MISLTSFTLFLSDDSLKVSFSNNKVFIYRPFSLTSSLSVVFNFSNWVSLYAIDDKRSESLDLEADPDPALNFAFPGVDFGVGIPPPKILF